MTEARPPAPLASRSGPLNSVEELTVSVLVEPSATVTVIESEPTAETLPSTSSA